MDYFSFPVMELCMYLYKFSLNPSYSSFLFSFARLGSVQQNKIQLLASQACCYCHQVTYTCFSTMVDKRFGLIMMINWLSLHLNEATYVICKTFVICLFILLTDMTFFLSGTFENGHFIKNLITIYFTKGLTGSDALVAEVYGCG